ncbi:cobalamin biosynthesis protein CbiG [Amantichitinum ursilacus]|uniref:Cobalamin biosynthesis protein CbiG n=2 Tax=Amantichitinum ursilacus TaxID=857265 RepID=A0A0N0XJQ0_9NEIS|nr:cobalamin biosynthesis protein CbiG [Amantichitinum ursilacus]
MRKWVVGIGCRRDVSAQQISAAVTGALAAVDGVIEQIAVIATLDSKLATPALLQFCTTHALPLHGFSVAQINALPVTWTPSAAAQAQLGVSGVSEPCALLAAAGGALVIPRFRLDGVTVAIAQTGST